MNARKQKRERLYYKDTSKGRDTDRLNKYTTQKAIRRDREKTRLDSSLLVSGDLSGTAFNHNSFVWVCLQSAANRNQSWTEEWSNWGKRTSMKHFWMQTALFCFPEDVKIPLSSLTGNKKQQIPWSFSYFSEVMGICQDWPKSKLESGVSVTLSQGKYSSANAAAQCLLLDHRCCLGGVENSLSQRQSLRKLMKSFYIYTHLQYTHTHHTLLPLSLVLAVFTPLNRTHTHSVCVSDDNNTTPHPLPHPLSHPPPSFQHTLLFTPPPLTPSFLSARVAALLFIHVCLCVSVYLCVRVCVREGDSRYRAT